MEYCGCKSRLIPPLPMTDEGDSLACQLAEAEQRIGALEAETRLKHTVARNAIEKWEQAERKLAEAERVRDELLGILDGAGMKALVRKYRLPEPPASPGRGTCPACSRNGDFQCPACKTTEDPPTTTSKEDA